MLGDFFWLFSLFHFAFARPSRNKVISNTEENHMLDFQTQLMHGKQGFAAINKRLQSACRARQMLWLLCMVCQ